MTNNQIVKSQEGLVEVFNFSQEKTPIRVKMVNNEPWFCCYRRVPSLEDRQ